MKIIDLHCDTFYMLYLKGGNLKSNHYHVDINKLQKGGGLAQFFALFIDMNKTKEIGAFNTAMEMLHLYNKQMEENKDDIRHANTSKDIVDDIISSFLAIEEGGALEGNIKNLHEFYNKGVRLMTLTWNYPNEIGYPNRPQEYMSKGLTPFGIDVVEEMNRLGMIVDVSHLSDVGFYDVARISKKPFVASHSNARGVMNHPRNLSDEMIKILAEKGGVMGVNFCTSFISNDGITRIDDIVRHIRHIHNVGGIEVIALGSDFDGITSVLEIENYSQMEKLIIALEKSGFSSHDIEKICYKNALNLIKEVIG